MKTSLTIAGIETELSVPAGPLEQLVAGRYAPFLGATVAPVRSVRLEPCPDLDGAFQPAAKLVERLTGATFRLDHPGFFGAVDLDGESVLYCAADPFSLDLALRTVFALAGSRHDALMLRACGVISGGAAHVFTGRSGSGTSTVVALAEHRPVLSDGAVMVRRLAEGNWLAASTPFWGTYEPPGPPRDLRLARLWSLQPSPLLCSLSSGPGETLRAVVENLILPSPDPELRQTALDLAFDLVSEVPSSELGFVASPSLWQEIEEAVV